LKELNSGAKQAPACDAVRTVAKEIADQTGKAKLMKLDHVAINAVNLEEEIRFLTEFLGLSLLQKWEDLRQAYVGLEEGPVIGVIENKDYDGSVLTMAHLAFCVSDQEFSGWVMKIKELNLDIVAGPKSQRGGETILFRTPSKNIIELCYPYVRKTIHQHGDSPANTSNRMEGTSEK